jgi:putative flippase GtrA
MTKYMNLIKQAALYGIVGVVTLGIDITVTVIIFNVAHLSAFLASAIGFLSGFFFSFPMNRKKVFHHHANDKFSLHSQIIMYISLAVFNLFATSAMVEFMVTNSLVTISVAKIIVTAAIAVWNFILFRQLIFSKVREEQ